MEPLTLAAGALGAIIAAALLSRRTGVATPLLVLLIGIGISYLPGVPEIDLEPE